jgi:hypothetical protein
MADLQGWQTDPFGVHQERYFSQGLPTRLVRDGGTESFDEPPSNLSTDPESGSAAGTVEADEDDNRRAVALPLESDGLDSRALETSRWWWSGRAAAILAAAFLLYGGVALALVLTNKTKHPAPPHHQATHALSPKSSASSGGSLSPGTGTTSSVPNLGLTSSNATLPPSGGSPSGSSNQAAPSGTSAPAAQTPEASLAIVLPIGVALVFGTAVGIRRRRHHRLRNQRP